MRAKLSNMMETTSASQTGIGKAGTVNTGKVGTVEQQAVWEDMRRMQRGGYGSSERAGHLKVNAVAGSGKTFTAVEGAKLLREGGRAPRIVYLAFNKSVQAEMQERAGGAVQAQTFHSAGYKAVRDALGYVKTNDKRDWDVMARISGMSQDRRVRGGLKKLIGLVKQYGVGVGSNWKDEVWSVVDRHALVLGDTDEIEQEVVGWVPKMLEASMEVRREEGIGFDDMVWLPYAMGLRVEQAELLVVDEAQDLNMVQRWYAARAGERVLVVGDRNQAIYGFRGAGVESMDDLGRELVSVTGQSVGERQLSYTRRCPVKVVELAQAIVPQIKPWEGAEEGIVREESVERAMEQMEEGDMVLCRTNPPLVKMAYKLIAKGKPARIRGREIHEGILKLLEGAGNYGSMAQVVKRAEEITASEVEKYMALAEGRGEHRAQLASDRLECFIACSEGCTGVGELRGRLEDMFREDRRGIVLSSVHKAKGLEADRVWILEPQLMPHPRAKRGWELQQEMNLKYVAVTRARRELVWVR